MNIQDNQQPAGKRRGRLCRSCKRKKADESVQRQTIGKQVIENGRKRNDTHQSIDRTDWKSYFGRIGMGIRVDRK